MKKIILAFAVSALLIPAFAWGASGMLGGAFTDNGISTKAISMGGAFTAIADDGNASWWNPAGMALLGKDKSVSITYVPDYFGTGPAFKLSDILVSYAQGDNQGWGALGGTVRYLSAGLGADYAGDTEYKWNEYTILVSWAMQIEKYFGLPKYSYPKIAAGVNVKYVGANTDMILGGAEVSASGIGVDAGLMVALKDNFKIGIMGKNLFTQVTWNGGSKETVPYSINAGVFYGITNDLAVSVEVKTDQDYQGAPAVSAYCGGAEYRLTFGKTAQVQAAFIRAGLQMDPNTNTYIISGGTAIVMDTFSLDYAYQQFLQSGLSNNNHRLGLTMNF